jgi:serine/threonine protein phosphatase 1
MKIMSRIYAIGDIHGCADRLEALIARLDIDTRQDRLIFIGDYIDRGPDPGRVVDTILELGKTIEHVICLLGNHEQMFLNYYLEHRDAKLFLANGGSSTLASYGFQQSRQDPSFRVPEQHLQFYQSLLPYYETADHIFVHAGLRPSVPLPDQNLDDLLWSRFEFIRSAHDFGKKVVFGHTPFAVPLVESNKIGIDTGAVYGGRLTCLELPAMIFHQV